MTLLKKNKLGNFLDMKELLIERKKDKVKITQENNKVYKRIIKKENSLKKYLEITNRKNKLEELNEINQQLLDEQKYNYNKNNKRSVLI